MNHAAICTWGRTTPTSRAYCGTCFAVHNRCPVHGCMGCWLTTHGPGTINPWDMHYDPMLITVHYETWGIWCEPSMFTSPSPEPPAVVGHRLFVENPYPPPPRSTFRREEDDTRRNRRSILAPCPLPAPIDPVFGPASAPASVSAPAHTPDSAPAPGSTLGPAPSTAPIGPQEPEAPPKRKRGRPLGSRNKIKDPNAPPPEKRPRGRPPKSGVKQTLPNAAVAVAATQASPAQTSPPLLTPPPRPRSPPHTPALAHCPDAGFLHGAGPPPRATYSRARQQAAAPGAR